MNNSVLLLGANIGNREEALQNAISLLAKYAGEVLIRSAIYETAPWGLTTQSSFLNQAITLRTSFSALNLLKEILNIEKEMGRIRMQKWEPRIIDIDILFFNEEVIQSDTLIVPHPLLQERRFALVPLNEILSSFIHPVFKCTISELVEHCVDQQVVDLYI